MSMSDAQRFAKDLASNKDLAEKVKAKAAGLASLVELGKANGYSFTTEEIKQVIRAAAKRDLTDDQLEAVAGGQGDPPSTTQSTGTNATAVVTVLDYSQVQVQGQVVTAAVQMVA